MSEWRKRYKVHPVADLFRMMSDDKLQKLGENILENGLKLPIAFCRPFTSTSRRSRSDLVLIDGRNRLEAMERAGLSTELPDLPTTTTDDLYAVSSIVSLNIHRRHLTKQEQADLIVLALKADADDRAARAAKVKPLSDNENKPRQVGEVSAKGGRGKIDPVKARAVATGKEHGVSQRTIERSFAKVTEPKPLPEKTIAGPRLRTRPKLETHVGIDAARTYYLDVVQASVVDLDAEQEIIADAFDALREIAGERFNQSSQQGNDAPQDEHRPTTRPKKNRPRQGGRHRNCPSSSTTNA